MKEVIEQTHVYEYLGKESDPLFKNILCLKANHSLFVSEAKIQVSKTKYGLYEIVSEEFHECYSNSKALYERVSDLLNAILSRGQ